MISDPVITVTCDECGCEDYFGLTATARGYDERNLAGDMERYGWRKIGDKDLCEDCAARHDQEAK